jgi:perosamine synthetase
MLKINQLAKKYSLKTIEDAAHALGAEYNTTKIGNHSDFVMFSFQAIKHITTIDGGALICRSGEDYKRGKLLRWYGIDREQKRKDFRCEENVLEYGYKFHMNDIAALIGVEQMKSLEDILAKQISNQQYYDKHLIALRGIRTIQKPSNRKSASWLYTIHVDERDHFVEWMNERGVSVSRVHERNDIHTAFEASRTHLPNLDQFNRTQVSIPVGWWLEQSDLEYIVSCISDFSKLK